MTALFPDGTPPPGICDEEGFLTWSELHDCAELARAQIAALASEVVAVRVSSGRHLLVMLLAQRGLDKDLVVAGPVLDPGALRVTGAGHLLHLDRVGRPSAVVDLPTEGEQHRPPGSAAGIWVFSSGTSGHPVPTRHCWSGPGTAVSGRSWRRGEYWGIGYAPFTFAGVTATRQALDRADRIEYVDPADLLVGDHTCGGFDVVAATPSFWRIAAICARRDGRGVRRVNTVSTGGEPVDDLLLEAIATVIRPGRVKQIFGTTETGTVIEVDDGRPGLPAQLAGQRLPTGAAFDVRDGMLIVSKGPDAPFVHTGDRVRLEAGRVLVIGRAGALINVGGRKVDPVTVAGAVQRLPSVLAARAYAVRSPVLGHVVGVDVVVSGEQPADEVADQVREFSRRHLDPHERPQRVRVVESLAIERSGKLRTSE
ncbi:class I adenylate-forming enzyme family protein [Kitasatospora terrestris]|uniref:AMP-binding enzyme C-terminal domain-containing protein n=1 Tax=Kitasatospora terrestris TaxID=258051 RepID=A0ABP9DE23_9ACTN